MSLATQTRDPIPFHMPREARELGTLRSIATRRAKAEAWQLAVGPQVSAMRSKGLKLREIADALNAQGLKTPNGFPYSNTQIHQLLQRATR